MSVDIIRGGIATVAYPVWSKSTAHYEVREGGIGSQIEETVTAGTASLAQPTLAERNLQGLPREELVNIARGAFGMWAGRDDIGDAVEYVRRLRASWRHTAED